MHNGYGLSIGKIDKYIQGHGKARVLLAVGLIVVVFVVYLLFGMQFSGPAYLSDEIGYLTKALALSGHSVDAASSWQGGYSFMILPAFWFFHDPISEWRAVLALNAVMWSISAGLLFYVLKRLYSKKSDLTLASVALLTLAYPAFISMSGYAFVTSGFVLVLMLAIASLVKSKLENQLLLIVSSLLFGYLYWIHPMGLVVVVSVILLFVSRAIYFKKIKKYIPGIVLLIILPSLYFLLVRPWLNDIMTPVGLSVFNHYNELATDIFSQIVTWPFWTKFVAYFLGQISYLLISTFGLIAYVTYDLFSGNEKGLVNKFKGILDDIPKFVSASLLVSVIGIAVLGAMCFASNTNLTKPDRWIYGRYTEMVILPLIAMALLSKWKFRISLKAVAVVLIAGLLLLVMVNEGNTDYDYIGMVNLQSFWPLVFIRDMNYFVWFVLGGFGILLVGLIGSDEKNKKWLLLMTLPLMVLIINVQTESHASMLKGRGDYLELVNIIDKTYDNGTCLGFDVDIRDGNQRFGFYSYYLQKFHVTRMEPGYWLKNCNGPYMTYNIDHFSDKSDIRVIAKESRSGLYVLMRADDIKSIIWPVSNRFIFYGDSRYEGCAIKGCLDWSASSGNADSTQVGIYQNGTLVTSGRAGYLLYGPKVYLGNGLYRLTINGNFRKLDDNTILTVVSCDGTKTYLTAVFDEGSTNNNYAFKLTAPVDDLEVRLYVSEDADIGINSYNVSKVR